MLQYVRASASFTRVVTQTELLTGRIALREQ